MANGIEGYEIIYETIRARYNRAKQSFENGNKYTASTAILEAILESDAIRLESANPDEIKRIKSELKYGYYDFKKDDEERVELIKIKNLIVNGMEVFNL